MSEQDAMAQWRANPFFVLGLPTDASRADIERAGQRLQALLGVNADAAKHYSTPFGPEPLDIEKVRHALTTLRDPAQRLACELWAQVASGKVTAFENKEAIAGWQSDAASLRWVTP